MMIGELIWKLLKTASSENNLYEIEDVLRWLSNGVDINAQMWHSFSTLYPASRCIKLSLWMSILKSP